MLEEFGGQERCLQRQRFFFGRMEACAKKQEVQNMKVVRRLLGKNFRLFSENTTCSVCKACMRIRRRDRMKVMKDMTKKIRSKGWMPKIDGGLLSCWRQTARKRGSIKERKKPCKNCINGWRR